MAVLIIQDPERERLKNIRKVAEENPYSFNDLLRIKKDGFISVNATEPRMCVLPLDFKVVLSLEQQPIGLLWHLSVSRAAPHIADPVMVQTIIDELDLGVAIEDSLHVWFEENVCDFAGNKTTAVNFIFKKRNADGTIAAENP